MSAAISGERVVPTRTVRFALSENDIRQHEQPQRLHTVSLRADLVARGAMGAILRVPVPVERVEVMSGRAAMFDGAADEGLQIPGPAPSVDDFVSSGLARGGIFRRESDGSVREHVFKPGCYRSPCASPLTSRPRNLLDSPGPSPTGTRGAAPALSFASFSFA